MNTTIILVPSLVTLLLLLANIFRNKKEKPRSYVILFLIIFIIELVFTSTRANASEMFTPNPKFEIEFFDKYISLSQEQKSYLKSKYYFHMSEGSNRLQEASDISLLIPNWNDKETAKELFESASASIFAGDLRSKAVAVLITL